jgi:hypothetical protein
LNIKTESTVLHEMQHISESEKIIHFEYIVIKPVGPGQAISSIQMKTHSFNTGHIINAGILYILESGQLKVLSTTGALLLEKNIGYDINPNDGMMIGED